MGLAGMVGLNSVNVRRVFWRAGAPYCTCWLTRGVKRGTCNASAWSLRGPHALDGGKMITQVTEPPIKPAGSATLEDFDRLDIRVGRIFEAAPLDGARKPAYRLVLDFGNGETRQSSAQLVATYPDPSVLVGRLVVAVVNFPPRRVAGWRSDVLVLGALPADGQIPLLSVDAGARPGDRIG